MRPGGADRREVLGAAIATRRQAWADGDERPTNVLVG